MAAMTPAAMLWLLARFPVAAGIFPSHWPLAGQLLIFVLGSEFVKYWMHRWGHETELGWRFHACHHSITRVYLLNGFRIHPLYHFVSYGLAIFPLLLLGAGREVTFLYSIVLGVAAVFQHANIDLKHGFLNRIFNTNDIHRWHHSPVLAEGNRNYGAILIVWDHLFGSWFCKPGSPSRIGMQGEETYPMNNYWKQIAAAFMPAADCAEPDPQSAAGHRKTA
jgi:sterol desaturase/sphingolipid hydroxylase (fatty acid hydroxylase superfamily)